MGKKSKIRFRLLRRELRIIYMHPIYLGMMVIMPLLLTLFFTSLMEQGQPVDMPIGIVDQDQTSTTRRLTRMIDGFQSSHVVAHYPTVDEARQAIQRNKIYGFVYFPSHMTEELIAGRQPKMSFYYTNTSLTAGSLLYKEMKTLGTLASAGVGAAKMTAQGLSKEQVQFLMQPIAIDGHNVGNPMVSYNIFLSAMLVPGCLMLMIFLFTAYCLGTELKFNTHKEWLAMADGNMWTAVILKLVPHTVINLFTMYTIMYYLFGVLHFPAPGGIWVLMLLGFLSVLASQGWGVFIFGLIPSLRMSMSVCSLWAVLSFSMVGSAFPVFAMDPPMHTLAWLFPLRHYYIIYQLCVFNTYPLTYVIWHVVALIGFSLLPLLVANRIFKAFREFGYIP